MHHDRGGGAWLINFLIKLFKGLLIDILQKKIDDVATTEFNNILSTIEQKYPLVMPLTGALLNTTQINLGLVPSTSSAAADDNTPSAFLVNGDYLIASGEFDFQSTTNSTVDPRQHDWIPDSMPTNPAGNAPMMGIAFDEYFLGSLLFTLSQNGKLDFTLDNDKLPPSSVISLNTKLFSTEYPALYAAYPNNNVSMVFAQYEDSPPLATTSPAGTSWSNVATMMLNVIDPTQPDPVVPVCLIMFNYSINTNFEIKDNTTSTAYFGGSISPLIFDASIIWAGINPGSFDTSIAGLIQALADDILIPILDSVLSKGIAIPMAFGGIEIQNMFVSYGNHVLTLGMDLALPSGVEAQTQTKVDAANALLDWEEQE